MVASTATPTGVPPRLAIRAKYAGSARFVWWLPRREEKCELALDAVGTPLAIGVLTIEAANFTSDTPYCPADCADLLAAKLGIELADEVTSLKQPSLVGGNVVEVKLEHLLRAASLV